MMMTKRKVQIQTVTFSITTIKVEASYSDSSILVSIQAKPVPPHRDWVVRHNGNLPHIRFHH